MSEVLPSGGPSEPSAPLPSHSLWQYLAPAQGGPGWELVGLYLTREAAADAALAWSRRDPAMVLALMRCGPDGEAIEPLPLAFLQRRIREPYERHLERCLQLDPSRHDHPTD